MNENSPVPRQAAITRDEASASNSEDPGSSAGQQRNGTSFWAGLMRLVRPSNANNLRENIADALLTDSESNTSFSPAERAMLHNILRFREVRVEDVMVPRADIDAVEQSTTVGELMSLFEETGRSRMPVYCETLDDPRGMVHIRDLLSWVMKQARSKRRATRGTAKTVEKTEARPVKTARASGFDLGKADLGKAIADIGIIRQLIFVPPSMHAADLMALMQADRIQMALVIDEYGGTDGLVSHEDIVEMVVGDIWDEHDDDEAMFRQTADDVFVADARVELEDLAEAIGPDFDIREQLEDVDSLGGLIFSALGRIPVRGELVNALPGFEFHILEADPRRVRRVRITRKRAAARRRPLKSDTEAEAMALQYAGDAAPEGTTEKSTK